MPTQTEMTTQQIADTLVKLCSKGKFDEAAEAVYSPDIVSIEAGAPPGMSRESKGIAAVKAKGEWWVANHEVHSVDVDGPLEQIGQDVEIHQRPEEEERLTSRRRGRDHRGDVEGRAGDRQGWAHATLHSVPARLPSGRGPDACIR